MNIMIDFDKLEKVAEFKDGVLKTFGNNACGVVYAIFVGDEYYIGSSVLLFRRIRQHLSKLLYNEHYTSVLQDKFNQIKEFSVYILEDCFCSDLREREKWWINTYLPSLNGKIAARKSVRGHKIPVVISDYSFQVLKELKFIASSKGCDMNEFSISSMIAKAVEEWLDMDYPEMRGKYSGLDRLEY